MDAETAAETTDIDSKTKRSTPVATLTMSAQGVRSNPQPLVFISFARWSSCSLCFSIEGFAINSARGTYTICSMMIIPWITACVLLNNNCTVVLLNNNCTVDHQGVYC